MIIKLTRFALMGMVALGLFACSSVDTTENESDPVSENVLSAIRAQGLRTENVYAVEGGYIVEGDIFLSHDAVNATPERQFLRVGESEQYHTTNVVTGLPRVISIYVSTSLPSSYVTATDEAIRRYNAEGLLLTFRRVTSSTGADIVFTSAPRSARYLASAGFPTSAGNPHNQVLFNVRAIGSNPNTNYLATIVAHEAGHCIGYRHTDYADRSYSCGGSYDPEGASTVGAVYIPGTAVGADPNSWMLACIGSGVNRPFNSNDKIALNYLY